MPNAHVNWDLETLTFILRAYVPIRAGEQVTVSYVDPGSASKARQEELSRRYKFVCKCKVCDQDVLGVMVSDLRRWFLHLRAYEEEIARDDEDLDRWVADGAPVRPSTFALNWDMTQETIHRLDSFARAKATLAVMEMEGWYRGDLWEPVLARLVKAYSIRKPFRWHYSTTYAT